MPKFAASSKMWWDKVWNFGWKNTRLMREKFWKKFYWRPKRAWQPEPRVMRLFAKVCWKAWRFLANLPTARNLIQPNPNFILWRGIRQVVQPNKDETDGFRRSYRFGEKF